MGMQNRTFIISRSDSIGDVVLTLPVAGVLRSLFPQSRILFLGRSYTEPVVRACEYVDDFINWDELQKLNGKERVNRLAAFGADTILHVLPNPEIAKLAKQAGIRRRIGTTNRLYHWLYCNRLVRLSRKHSPYHEAQLNLKLLTPLGAKGLYSLPEIGELYGLTRISPLPDDIARLLDRGKFNLILHPKSRGHGREWGLDNFMKLVEILPQDRFKLFVTGTAEEGKLVAPLLAKYPFLTDMTGKLTLSQFMSFIAGADGLIASGTGPLHLAAALGINALGLFPPIRPIHPGRWRPIGRRANFFVKDKNCSDCRLSLDCTCIRDLRPDMLREYLLSI
jgi:ADP-heptose:LPS heptosyltransferase